LDLLTGYERAIIIDATQTGKGKVGQVYRFQLGELDTTQHTTTSHGIDFVTALEMGKKLGLALPQQITIFAIEVQDVNSFGESCTPEVTKAIPICARMIIQEINGNFKTKVA
jgi:hydrogenase maturation protease